MKEVMPGGVPTFMPSNQPALRTRMPVGGTGSQRGAGGGRAQALVAPPQAEAEQFEDAVRGDGLEDRLETAGARLEELEGEDEQEQAGQAVGGRDRHGD